VAEGCLALWSLGRWCWDSGIGYCRGVGCCQDLPSLKIGQSHLTGMTCQSRASIVRRAIDSGDVAQSQSSLPEYREYVHHNTHCHMARVPLPAPHPNRLSGISNCPWRRRKGLNQLGSPQYIH